LRPGDRIALCGPLGSGKTTFVRGLARGLGVDPSGVHSPTFTRVHHYRGAATLVHVDLYRVESLEAYQELGLEAEEESDSIVVFEWGERLPAGTPHPGIRIDFELESESRRCLRLTRGESTGPDPGKR
jgi:tRNA threonylcarbamoyladenosine biosynthesis protein TsaE